MIDALRNYLRLLDQEARASFAARCDTSVGHLRNVSYGQRPASAELCVAVELESGGAVRRWHMRPGDWWRVWPELIGVPGAPRVPKAALPVRAAAA